MVLQHIEPILVLRPLYHSQAADAGGASERVCWLTPDDSKREECDC